MSEILSLYGFFPSQLAHSQQGVPVHQVFDDGFSFGRSNNDQRTFFSCQPPGISDRDVCPLIEQIVAKQAAFRRKEITGSCHEFVITDFYLTGICLDANRSRVFPFSIFYGMNLPGIFIRGDIQDQAGGIPGFSDIAKYSQPNDLVRIYIFSYGQVMV